MSRLPFRAVSQGRRPTRILIFASLLVLFLFIHWLRDVGDEHSHTGQSTEISRLDRHMNGHIIVDKTISRGVTTRETLPVSGSRWTQSSFNWSSVNFRYQPSKEETSRPLPWTQVGTGSAAWTPPSAPISKRVSLPRIQHIFPPEQQPSATTRIARLSTVKSLFQKNWASYRKHAWLRDALLPISGQGRDQFSGWAATLVDSLDTLWIMGLREEFDEAVDAVCQIDFGVAMGPRVNMFETNIRYLGGLLGAWDLSGREGLRVKAKEVGDLLYAGFNTRNRMPVDFIDFEGAKVSDSIESSSRRGNDDGQQATIGEDREGQGGLEVESRVVSASPGTIILEFTRLSQITGDPKYYRAASRITDLFERAQNNTKLPGMWPTMVSMRSEDVTWGDDFQLGSYADSLYEYLPKMHTLLEGKEGGRYGKMSQWWMDTADRNMFYRPMLPDERDVLISGQVKVDAAGRPILNDESEHLACFLGGVYALGGRILQRPDFVETGSKLAMGCAYTYTAMPTGLGPERFNMAICESRDQCDWNLTKFGVARQQRPEWTAFTPAGFTTTKDPRYILRPEAIESIFILWRITGRQEFQDVAWQMFEAVANGTETEYANAAVLDVTKKADELPKEDYMESFWLAETLKYFYLAFTAPDVISLDEFVFNTEAHPFRRSGG